MSYKIIRDKIPLIAEQNQNRKGMTLTTFKPEDDSTVRMYFRGKILEEATEVFETVNDRDLKWEIVDLIQAVDEFMIYLGISDEELETLVKAKQYTQGKFIHSMNEETLETKMYVLDIKENGNG